MDEYYYEQKEIKIRQIVIIEQKGKAPYNTARNRPKLPCRPYSLTDGRTPGLRRGALRYNHTQQHDAVALLDRDSAIINRDDTGRYLHTTAQPDSTPQLCQLQGQATKAETQAVAAHTKEAQRHKMAIYEISHGENCRFDF